jgi:hypothetical protein
MPDRAIQTLLMILLQVTFLSIGCGNQSADMTEDGKAKESLQQQSLGEVDWGREIDLDQMIVMAKKGQIVEIQWHIMPNILRAEASDGEIFHLRNENKGVDLRNALINAGVKVGKGGVLFRHLF